MLRNLWTFLIILFATVAAALSMAAPAQPRFAFEATPGSLPKDVVPTVYRLTLDLDPARDVFTGTTEITVQVKRPTDAIVVSAHELVPNVVALERGGDVRTMTVTDDQAKRQWRIADGRAIEAGEYTLRIEYRGAVNVYGEGIFRVSYSALGQPATMLATQLEPIAARRVFPGFDEPSFRARFAISVTAPADYEVVSNMPVQSREARGTSVHWAFAPTPPMPSYLVAVAVGQFEALEDQVDGIPLRILTARGRKESARYAMEVTRQVLPFFREYFGIPYALPKLDQLAIPGVRGGAMEDWGAISYVESVLLYDPARSSSETRQTIFSIVAHEISHQWFGNLVTAASWDEIWLNEAFATWIAGKATARFNPDWQVPLRQMLRRQNVMRRDAGPATRAIRSGPVVETAVFDVFDGVTYIKGGAVLDMLEAYVGPEPFRRGLAAYMAERRLSNATAGDLWFHLSEASGRDVVAVARSWTDQPGYPLLQARFGCSGGERTLALEQRRFSMFGAADDATVWMIPFAVGGAMEPTARSMLDRREGSFAAGSCAATPAYIDTAKGFFRVQYPSAHLRDLAAAFPRLPVTARLSLLTDTYALGQAGRLPLADYFALVDRLHPAGDAATLMLYTQAVGALRSLDNTLAGTPAQDALRRYTREKLWPMLALIGWSPSKADDAVTLDLRNELVDVLGRVGDVATLERSYAMFSSERRSGVRVDASIRPAVIANVARAADAGTFAVLVADLMHASRVEDREMYAEALAGVQNPQLARKLLALALTDLLPPETAARMPGMVAASPEHADLAYMFVRDHFDSLASKSSEWGRVYLLPSAASGFSEAPRAKALLVDQSRLVGLPGQRAAEQAAADIELRSRVRASNGASLAAELARQGDRR